MAGSNAFTLAQRAVLTGVLDALIPASADARFPGAGELGLAPAIEEKLGAMRPFVAPSLDALDALARERTGHALASLAPAERKDVLDAHAVSDPGFLGGLVFQVYCAYYEHPRVIAALGLAVRPPHPEGYALEQPDLEGLLTPVRERGPRYRDA